jgi:hypothetical protein
MFENANGFDGVTSSPKLPSGYTIEQGPCLSSVKSDPKPEN